MFISCNYPFEIIYSVITIISQKVFINQQIFVLKGYKRDDFQQQPVSSLCIVLKKKNN